jgi:hypothetical protein
VTCAGLLKCLTASLLLCATTLPVSGQVAKDSLKVHSPKKAALLSATLPGAGQIYNRKYWKLPIVYGGMGTGIFFIAYNHKRFSYYRNGYLLRLDDISGNEDATLADYSDDNLITLQDTYRRWRDLSVIITAGVYAFQIIDAVVDAHLFNFDVNASDDLSMRFSPAFQLLPNGAMAAGLRVRLQFRKPPRTLHFH